MNTKLLRRVQKLILAEPKRADINEWQLKVDTEQKDAPACGTIGCIAGWADILHRLDKRKLRATPSNIRTVRLRLRTSVFDRGSKALGLTWEQAYYLFKVLWPEPLRIRLRGTVAQTPEHAQVISDAIDAFIKNPDAFIRGEMPA